MLAVFMAASSITVAGDTLRIQSRRTVDLCSNDSTFLLTGSIGEVFFSDSLMYFDITLKYDTSVLRPTQGFPQGTLAGQLDFGEDNPAYDLRTRGEIGISAFSISTNAKGNLPLFAIGGYFVGSCHDRDSIRVPYPADYIDFNEEFKRKVTLYTSEIFEAVANPISHPDLGPSFTDHSLQIEYPDSTAQMSVTVNSAGLNGAPVVLTLTNSSTNGIAIDSIAMAAITPDSIVRIDDRTLKIYYVASANAADPVVFVSTRHRNEYDTTTVTASLESHEDCGCIRPTKQDSIKIFTHKQTVSMISDVDEGSATLLMMDDVIEVQGVHGQPGFLTVFALDGAIVYRAVFVESETHVRIPIHDLPHGAYFVAATWGGLTLTNKLLK